LDKLEIALYGGAIYLAIKSLVSLMADHSRVTKRRATEELEAAKRAAAEAAAPPAPAAPAKPEKATKKAA
jgi:hypothetical protein